MIGVSSFAPGAPYREHFLRQLDNWPGEVILYLEAPLDFDHEKLIKRSLFDIPHLVNFLTYLKQVPRAKGILQDGSYSYNYDVWKFCRKMFCQYDAFREGGKVFWLDADIEIKKPVPITFLENLFDGEPLAYLGREGFYTETGFVGFDTDHPDFPSFEKRYRDVLKTGTVFTLKGWHDCYCFDYAKTTGKSLTSWKPGDPLDVIGSSEIGEYFYHHKGKRKLNIS